MNTPLPGGRPPDRERIAPEIYVCRAAGGVSEI